MSTTPTTLATPAILLSILLGACASTPPVPPRTTAATKVAVADNSSPLARKLNQVMIEHGWSLTSYNPKTLQTNRDYQQLGQRAHYRLTLSARRIGDCRNKDPSYLYNVALIENPTGHVAVARTGADCLGTVVKQFEADLERKQLDVPNDGTAPGHANH